ncbi:right-handed parallel beta-helix repeat-containing protein [Nostoc sp. NIES-2111]
MTARRNGRHWGVSVSNSRNTAFGSLAWLVLAFAMSWSSASVASARTIYVAPNGTDDATGTSVWPIRTINQAVKVAVAGDKIIVRDGVYQEIVQVWKGGTKTRPLQIVAEHKGLAVIQGTGTPWDTDLVAITADNVQFSGFTVRGSTRSGISVWKASDVLVADNTVTESQRAGIWVGAPGLGQSTRVRIIGNTVINNCLENSDLSWTGGWPRAIAVDVSTVATISKNVVAQNYGEGIGLLSTQNAKINKNSVFDNFSVEIYLDNAPQSTVTQNIVFSTADTSFFRTGNPAYGILIANEATEFYMPSRKIRVTGNTLIGSGTATYVGVDHQGSLIESTIRPNTARATMNRDALIKSISRLVKIPVASLLPCSSVLLCPTK